MNIGHFSDIHGRLDILMSTSELPDVWICSGDFFPNLTRGEVETEANFQAVWFSFHVRALIQRFGGKPVLWVGGNHDYVNLATLLREHGYRNAHDINVTPFEIEGHRIVGAEGVPWMAGEWRTEEHDLSPMVERAFEQDPTILVTHGPVAGILDDDHGAGHGCGNRPLAMALAYRPHRITTHLCGHIHEQSGGMVEEMGIRFYNNAETLRFIDV